jgi:hypothetical protein
MPLMAITKQVTHRVDPGSVPGALAEPDIIGLGRDRPSIGDIEPETTAARLRGALAAIADQAQPETT